MLAMLLSSRARNALGAFAVGLSLLVFARPGQALTLPVLDGDDVTVEFDDDLGFGSETDTVTVGLGPEISFGNGTNIGNIILLDSESIDLDGLSITYTIQGGGDRHPDNSLFQLTGFGPNAFLEFTGINLVSVDGPWSLTGVGLALTDIIGVSLGDVTFTPDSVRLFLSDDIGVLATRDVGKITLNLGVRLNATPIPEPGTFGLVGLGIAGLAAWRRRLR